MLNLLPSAWLALPPAGPRAGPMGPGRFCFGAGLFRSPSAEDMGSKGLVARLLQPLPGPTFFPLHLGSLSCLPGRSRRVMRSQRLT